MAIGFQQWNSGNPLVVRYKPEFCLGLIHPRKHGGTRTSRPAPLMFSPSQHHPTLALLTRQCMLRTNNYCLLSEAFVFFCLELNQVLQSATLDYGTRRSGRQS
ncbi:hypothetical protein GOP47_0016214 [Adiantum capillus-veneris]|uniref:Uncharacterized protein n=1 Tax=Adiantum capillus-veneris TaxID=13818 RepID=A0A9D4ZAJ7_ADICA|nr:hypothetical protein GOP47_0016214 [Adiantum capillus-veneris]